VVNAVCKCGSAHKSELALGDGLHRSDLVAKAAHGNDQFRCGGVLLPVRVDLERFEFVLDALVPVGFGFVQAEG
jgi:hypothetical protein